ncbi:MAG: acyl-CoA/acyl-ACP dehydrogenase [Burkholderiaceae bacterium]|nr:acyl-CoA/acyl-ACP dehydrogenase [Burkholderiaceae bacterium]
MAEVVPVDSVGAQGLAPTGILDGVRAIADRRLPMLAQSIDADSVYPEDLMREFGAAGAYFRHLPMGPGLTPRRGPDLETSIRAMSIAAEHCLSTAFCIWCQDALGWYIYNGGSDALKAEIGSQVAMGEVLGGTGLSNPMKTVFGIEKLKLRATAVDGGYRVSGNLPWVSNLGPGHWFGIVFSVGTDNPRNVMAIVDCDADGLTMVANDNFLALGGTRTYGLAFREVFVPEAHVIADPLEAFLPKIRAGFILLQAGMAFGLIQSSIRLMEQMKRPLGHVNSHLPEQPEYFAEQLAAMEGAVFELAKTPYETSQDYFAEVIRARLLAGDATVQAAHAAMLHCGARGYVTGAEAQRRLREAYFVAIVTPATKQLRKMLADMGEPLAA